MQTLVILLILWLSVAAGYLLRHRPVRGVGRLTAWTVWLLLFLMGEEVGGNPEVLLGLGRIGFDALVLTACTAIACTCLAGLYWKILRRKETRAEGQEGNDSTEAAIPLRVQMRDSLVIVGFFFIGCLAGYNGWCGFLPEQAGFHALCLLLACVGLGIGQNREIRARLRRMDKRLMALPLLTILATWGGAAVTAVLLPHYGMADWLAASSGFGYYSLSGILITELRGSTLGTLALVYNILRELVVLLCAPFLRRLFGPLAPISQGGATSGDTTLPVITAACGPQYAPLSIYHGICVDFTVPFLVPFFCSWT